MKRFLETLTAWEGAVRGDAVHKRIVDAYNSFRPHPRGYKLTYTDDYCAAMVSAAAILCGLTEVLPVECSCGEQMKWYQSRGKWIEDDAHVPTVGEQVFYCWNDRKDYALTDCACAPNHTGVVTACDGQSFTVFEGNKGKEHKCAYRIIPVNGRYIRGFGIPAYHTEKRTLVRGDKGAAIRKCGVDHYMRYMDNFTLLASSKRKLRNAKKELERRLRIIGLRLKGNWQIFRTEHRMVTALGYRFGHGFTLLRKRNLMRLKRQTARVLKIMRRKAKVSFQAASGLISRIGQLTHCNSENIRKKYIPRGLLKQLKNIVRKECKKWKALNTFSVTTATP